MQPTAVLDIQRSGDLGGHKVAMKFDENSIAHIMSVLTDLYSDPELAIIREYSTNAWDSHVEVGTTRPIEVFTPSNLSPFFRVKDYGVGLDLDGIENIYSQYGASTKRETNEQTGMLGLGCKSALTYTNQFTLVAVKNGIKTSVMISRVEDGTGVMEVLFQKPTDEPNGVEVVIPVRFSTSFEDKVTEFFSYWKKGTVLLNDREPSLKDAKRVGNTDIYMAQGASDDVIVMGNVAYPVNSSQKISGNYGGYNRQFHLIAFVPIGSINFTPSREALHYTNRTNETIVNLRKQFAEAIKTTIQNDIDAADTHSDAIERFFKWRAMINGIDNCTYRNAPIVTNYKVDNGYFIWNRNAYRYSMDRSNYADYKFLSGVMIVTGFELEKVTPTHRKKAVEWMSQNNKSYSRVVFIKEMPGSPWTDHIETVHYDDIKAIKLAPASSRPKRVAKYDVLDSQGRTVETDQIDATKAVYFFSPKEYKSHQDVLVSLFPDAALVSLGRNRFDKFKRDFPSALPLTISVIRQRLTTVYGMLTDEDKIYLSCDRWTRSNISLLPAAEFDDPEIVKYINGTQVTPSGNLALYQKTVQALNALGIYGLPEMTVKSIASPFNKYPLIGNITGRMNVEHIVLYCNAVFNNKEKNNV